MSRTTRFAAIAALVATPACQKPNPAFNVGTDGASGTTTAATTSAAPTTSDAPTTTSADTDMTSGPGSTGVGMTSTTGVGGSSGPDSTSEMSSETGYETTGGAVDCWELGVDAWTVEPLELEPPGNSPSLSPDALTVYYRAFNGGEWQFFRAVRPATDQAFGPGELFFDAIGGGIDYPEFVEPTEELFFTGSGGDIYVVARDGMTWGQPIGAGGAKAFGIKTESHSNLTADGATMLFQRDDGPPFGQFVHSYNFYQIARDPQLHATFPDDPPLKVTPVDPGFGLSACPALAPDGLHLFFSGFDSRGGGEGDPNDGRVGVWYARRDALADATWSELTRSEQLRVKGRATCPVSVSADGCQLTLLHFTINENEATEILLARRGG